MQEIFEDGYFVPAEFIETISPYRFDKYQKLAYGQDQDAIRLYLWNLELSQSFYVYIHFWEIALRNKINGFFNDRYGTQWIFDEKTFIRNLQTHDKIRVKKAITSKQKSDPIFKITFSESFMLITELSAGFWVSQLSKSYEIPYGWNNNIHRILPYAQNTTRAQIWTSCDRILKVRNRLSHHEPIFHLPLPDIYQDLQFVVGAMCRSTFGLANSLCNFNKIWANRPIMKRD